LRSPYIPGPTQIVSPDAAFSIAWLIERQGLADDPQLLLSVPLLATMMLALTTGAPVIVAATSNGEANRNHEKV
jgi:hypothetical protein